MSQRTEIKFCPKAQKCDIIQISNNKIKDYNMNNISRRGFLGGAAALGGMAMFSDCNAACKLVAGACKSCKPQLALQLYSIKNYIKTNGIIKTLEDVAKIGYKGVEFFAGDYYGVSAAELTKVLKDNGLVNCGIHCQRKEFGPDVIEKYLDMQLSYGCNYICCPGGGNVPAGCGWNGKGTPKLDDMKKLCEYYNKAAETAEKKGCYIALHNHMWEHQLKLEDGTSYWDYFFTNTDKRVQMEQDVGWSVCAGVDPCKEFLKYPNRSINVHAKENGMGKGVKKFDAILGQPGQPGAIGVDWDKVIATASSNGSKWMVVECEKHFDSLYAVTESYKFLKTKGL